MTRAIETGALAAALHGATLRAANGVCLRCVAWKHLCFSSSSQERRTCCQMSAFSAQGCSQEAAVPGILVFSCFADACELISWLPSMGQNIRKWSILLWVALKHFCRRSSTQVRRVCRQMSLSSAQGLLHNAALPGMLAYFCVVDTCVELSGLARMAQSDRKRSDSSLGSTDALLLQQKQ